MTDKIEAIQATYEDGQWTYNDEILGDIPEPGTEAFRLWLGSHYRKAYIAGVDAERSLATTSNLEYYGKGYDDGYRLGIATAKAQSDSHYDKGYKDGLSEGLERQLDSERDHG